MLFRSKMLYLGVADTHAKQLTILQALTRKFALAPDCSLAAVAETLPFTYTGADLYALCSDAMLKAITRQARSVDRRIRQLEQQQQQQQQPQGRKITTAWFFDHAATPDDTRVVVSMADFAEARRELVGSVRSVASSLPSSFVVAVLMARLIVIGWQREGTRALSTRARPV